MQSMYAYVVVISCILVILALCVCIFFIIWKVLLRNSTIYDVNGDISIEMDMELT